MERMKRRPRPSFVLTVAAAAVALPSAGCDGSSKAPPESANAAKAAPVPKSGYLNPVDPVRGTIYTRGASCFVAAKDPPPSSAVSLQPPRTEDVPCPAAFQDPAWKACPNGILNAETETSTECTCSPFFANPPPVAPFPKVACPKR
jgi:hypothetical protein